MICPKCQSLNAEPTVSWTLCGRKMTLPQVRVWACLNLKCRYEWPRDITSPVVASSIANDTAFATQIVPRPKERPLVSTIDTRLQHE